MNKQKLLRISLICLFALSGRMAGAETKVQTPNIDKLPGVRLDMIKTAFQR